MCVWGSGPRLVRVWGGCAQGRDAMCATATLSETEDAWTVVQFRQTGYGEMERQRRIRDRLGSAGSRGGRSCCRCESRVCGGRAVRCALAGCFVASGNVTAAGLGRWVEVSFCFRHRPKVLGSAAYPLLPTYEVINTRRQRAAGEREKGGRSGSSKARIDSHSTS